MRRTAKRLQLSGETLRLLRSDQLRGAHGGVVTDTDSALCQGSGGSAYCLTHAPDNCTGGTGCVGCVPNTWNCDTWSDCAPNPTGTCNGCTLTTF